MSEEKRGVGRPSGYTPEVQAMADDYLLEGYLDNDGVIPSVAGLACFLGVSRSTIYKWRDESTEFSDTLAGIEVKQEHITLSGGMANRFNSTIAKLVLANHGYSDKQAVDHTTNGESIGPTRIVIEAAVRKE